jgi:integration host factor subunit alpha
MVKLFRQIETNQTIKGQKPAMTLTKMDIINAVQQELGFTKNQSTELTEQVLEILKRTLASGEDVLISGFGRFCVKDKSRRRGRNPATGEDLMLAPRRVVTFKCSGKLREKINGSGNR